MLFQRVAKVNGRVLKIERCCGKSGTFALTRPDIATQVRFRKVQELQKGVAELRDHGNTGRERDRSESLVAAVSVL